MTVTDNIYMRIFIYLVGFYSCSCCWLFLFGLICLFVSFFCNWETLLCQITVYEVGYVCECVLRVFVYVFACLSLRTEPGRGWIWVHVCLRSAVVLHVDQTCSVLLLEIRFLQSPVLINHQTHLKELITWVWLTGVFEEEWHWDHLTGTTAVFLYYMHIFCVHEINKQGMAKMCVIQQVQAGMYPIMQ